jgi:hypothetical protein
LKKAVNLLGSVGMVDSLRKRSCVLGSPRPFLVAQVDGPAVRIFSVPEGIQGTICDGALIDFHGIVAGAAQTLGADGLDGVMQICHEIPPLR